MACRCDNHDCPAKFDDGTGSSSLIHVITDFDALGVPQDPGLNGEAEATGAAPKSEPAPAGKAVALIPGVNGAILPAPLLAELVARGATVRFVGASDLKAGDRYRPSAALQEFVRSRDLTCRFPGCDRPAVTADIDHTAPWPAGPTQPGNLKCYCRIQHLIKTFRDGWTDRQLPDGTLVVTTPTGLSFTTKPFSRLLFPRWNTTTPSPPPRGAAAPTRPGRQLMMPTRRRTRAENRTARITSERRLNAEQRAHDIRQRARDEETGAARFRRPAHQFLDDHQRPEGRPDYGDDPPPF